jgi:hypothetical protein
LPTPDEVKVLARAIEGGLLDDLVREYVRNAGAWTNNFDECDRRFSTILGFEVAVYNDNTEDYGRCKAIWDAVVDRVGKERE